MTRSHTERLLARPEPAASRFRFTARRCRRRCARALAAGRGVAEVARIERVPAIELEALLGDAQFQALLAHYAAIAALPRAERLARLASVALEVLEHAVEAGELRASMFVLHEHRAGRDPSLTLAEAALVRIEADQAQAGPRPVPAGRARAGTRGDRPAAAAHAADGPSREPVLPDAPGRSGRSEAALPDGPGRPDEAVRSAPRDAAWTHCAMAHGHVMDAELCAVRDLRQVEAGLRQGLAALAERLAGEAERVGTGLAASQAVADEMTARGVARAHHGRARSVDGLIRLDRRRRAAGFGRPDLPPPGPVEPAATDAQAAACDALPERGAPPDAPAPALVDDAGPGRTRPPSDDGADDPPDLSTPSPGGESKRAAPGRDPRARGDDSLADILREAHDRFFRDRRPRRPPPG